MKAGALPFGGAPVVVFAALLGLLLRKELGALLPYG